MFKKLFLENYCVPQCYFVDGGILILLNSFFFFFQNHLTEALQVGEPEFLITFLVLSEKQTYGQVI